MHMNLIYFPKQKEWFIERIGKRIYRDPTTCPCHHCKDISENGLVVGDEQHAGYLADCDMEFGAEGEFLNYRDEK